MSDVSRLTLAVDSRQIRSATRDLNSFGSESGRTESAMSGLRSEFGLIKRALVTLGFAGLAREVFQANVRLEALISTLTFATGSAANAARDLGYLKKISKELGLNLSAASVGFSQISAAAYQTSLQGQGVKDIFEAVSKASVVMHLSADQTAGAFLAINQMMSKGKVMAQELRLQLGERIPGAFQIAARAMGMTTKALGDYMEAGKLFTADFIPKFAIELTKTVSSALPYAIKGAQAELNRLTTAFGGIKTALGKGEFMEAIVGSFRFLTPVLEGIRDNIKLVVEGIKTLTSITVGYLVIMKGLPLAVNAVTASIGGLSAAYARAIPIERAHQIANAQNAVHTIRNEANVTQAAIAGQRTRIAAANAEVTRLTALRLVNVRSAQSAAGEVAAATAARTAAVDAVSASRGTRASAAALTAAQTRLTTAQTRLTAATSRQTASSRQLTVADTALANAERNLVALHNTHTGALNRLALANAAATRTAATATGVWAALTTTLLGTRAVLWSFNTISTVLFAGWVAVEITRWANGFTSVALAGHYMGGVVSKAFLWIGKTSKLVVVEIEHAWKVLTTTLESIWGTSQKGMVKETELIWDKTLKTMEFALSGLATVGENAAGVVGLEWKALTTKLESIWGTSQKRMAEATESIWDKTLKTMEFALSGLATVGENAAGVVGLEWKALTTKLESIWGTSQKRMAEATESIWDKTLKTMEFALSGLATVGEKAAGVVGLESMETALRKYRMGVQAPIVVKTSVQFTASRAAILEKYKRDVADVESDIKTLTEFEVTGLQKAFQPTAEQLAAAEKGKARAEEQKALTKAQEKWSKSLLTEITTLKQHTQEVGKNADEMMRLKVSRVSLEIEEAKARMASQARVSIEAKSIGDKIATVTKDFDDLRKKREALFKTGRTEYAAGREVAWSNTLNQLDKETSARTTLILKLKEEQTILTSNAGTPVLQEHIDLLVQKRAALIADNNATAMADVEGQVNDIQRKNEAIGKTEAALVLQNIARQKELILSAQARGANDDEIAKRYALIQGIKDQRRLTVQTDLEGQIEQIRRQNDQINKTSQAVELSNIARQKALFIANRTELTTQKEIEQQRELIGLLRSGVYARKAKTAWKSVATTIQNSLTDAIMGAFDSGKSFAESFADSIKSAFKSMVLKPVVQYIVSGGTAMLGLPSLAGAAGAGGGGAGGMGIGGWLNAGSTLESVWSNTTGGMSAAYTTAATSSIGQSLGLGEVATVAGAPINAGAPYAASLSELGTAVGTGLSYVGAGLAGITAGTLLAGDKTIGAINGLTSSVVGALGGALLGAQIGAGLGPVGALIGGIGGGAINAMFGHGPRETRTTTLQGTVGSGGIKGAYKTPWVEEGGWFRSDKRGEDSTALEPKQIATFKAAITATKDIFHNLMRSANEILPSSYGWSFAFDRVINTKEQQDELMMDIADSMGKYLIPSLDDFQKEGERLADTAVRLSDTFQLTSRMVAMMGKETENAFGAIGLASGEMRVRLVDLLGGVQSASSAIQSYYQAFFSDAERRANDIRELTASLAVIGVDTLPETREGFRSLVEAQDLATEAGQNTFASLISLAPAFASLFEAVDNSAEIEKTAKAMETFNKSLTQFRDTLSKDSLIQTPEVGYAQNKKEFLSISNLATLGNMEAISVFQTAATNFITASKEYSTTRLDFARDVAFVTSALNNVIAATEPMIDTSAPTDVSDTRWKASGFEFELSDVQRAFFRKLYGSNVPGFADGGYHSGGLRVVGEQGPELEFTPPSYIAPFVKASRSGAGDTSSKEAVEEIRALRAELKAANIAIVKNTSETSRTLRRWNGDGLPEERVA